MLRFVVVLLLLLLTVPIPRLWPAGIAGLPGWVWQAVTGAVLFAIVVSWLLQKYWDET